MSHSARISVVIGFCLALSTLPAAGAEPARDPAVAEVLVMLESGVSEAVLLRWVSAAGHAPREVTADDLIALTRAGASDDLLDLMISLAEEAPQGDPETLVEEARTAVPAEAPAPGGRTASAVSTAIENEYRPAFLADGDDPWDLYVYLDGRPLTWVSRGSQLSPSAPVRFERRLSPGRHVLRLAVENHERRSKGRFYHEARVAPEELVFQLEPSGNAAVSVKMAQPRFTLGGFGGGEKGPLTIEIRQGEKTLQSLRDVGRAADEWPELCEEIEANLEPEAKVPRRVAKRLGECLRWPEIWRGVEGEIPARDEVRAELERLDYRPLAR